MAPAVSGDGKNISCGGAGGLSCPGLCSPTTASSSVDEQQCRRAGRQVGRLALEFWSSPPNASLLSTPNPATFLSHYPRILCGIIRGLTPFLYFHVPRRRIGSGFSLL